MDDLQSTTNENIEVRFHSLQKQTLLESSHARLFGFETDINPNKCSLQLADQFLIAPLIAEFQAAAIQLELEDEYINTVFEVLKTKSLSSTGAITYKLDRLIALIYPLEIQTRCKQITLNFLAKYTFYESCIATITSPNRADPKIFNTLKHLLEVQLQPSLLTQEEATKLQVLLEHLEPKALQSAKLDPFTKTAGLTYFRGFLRLIQEPSPTSSDLPTLYTQEKTNLDQIAPPSNEVSAVTAEVIAALRVVVYRQDEEDGYRDLEDKIRDIVAEKVKNSQQLKDSNAERQKLETKVTNINRRLQAMLLDIANAIRENNGIIKTKLEKAISSILEKSK